MANDNKKSNELVADQDDDPTAELEALLAEEIGADRDVEAESDANTFGFEQAGGEADESIASLKSDLKSRDRTIEKQQFDIEQLRSKWAGLEEEIKVREEVTSNLTEQLNRAHKKQSRTERSLKKRETEVAVLNSRASQSEQAMQDLARQLEIALDKEQESTKRAAELRSRVATLEQKLTTVSEESRRAHSQTVESREKVLALSAELDSLKNDLAASRASVSELQQYIDGRKTEWSKQETRLLENETRIAQQSADLHKANAELQDRKDMQDEMATRLILLTSERDHLSTELARLRNSTTKQQNNRAEETRRLAEQEGLLTGKTYENKQLRSQITRTEAYADDLRRQLQDQLSLRNELQMRQKLLEISLADANRQIQESSAVIEGERARNAELAKEQTVLEEKFEKDVRQIRFELGEAQETIVDRESLAERLSSDLVDTREFSLNLESRLSTAEQESSAIIEILTNKLNKAERLNDELKYKINNKDNAISALLSELTKRSEAVDAIVEKDNTTHESDDRSGVERERVTRLLVGNIDGQKLRFPLFKDRLTIGRTGHNDIQLKAPYISRRHAVIVTDDEGTRIIDWGSKNGVFVNSNRVKDQILRNGDIVTIGTADFRFEERQKR